MEIALSLAENVIEHLGEEVIISGVKTKGVFSKEKNEFGDYLDNPRVFFHVTEETKSKPGGVFEYKGNKYEITRITKEQNGIKRLELKCVKEKKLEMILPRA